MPRATTKDDLIKMANEQLDKLWKIIDGLNENMQNADFCFDTENAGSEAHWKRDKNLRDVIIHLYEWHKLLLGWEKANALGDNRPFLPPSYSWKSYGNMNIEFWQMHQNTPLIISKELLKDTHNQVIAVIKKYTDEQLFTKAFYKWTGTSSLGQYCISVTLSHYDWAIKKLKLQIKSLKLKALKE